jgi:glycosyltransferase involved in cell wall biosynthesis
MNYKSQTVCAVLITCNNIDTIERALESVKWTDEIIVLDCGSTDGTIELARRFTDKVYFHPSGCRTVLRNYAFALAKSDWVLHLEPEEWVEEMLRHEIDGQLLNDSPVDGFYIPQKLYFQGQWLKKGRMYPNLQLRLFRRSKGYASDHVHHSEILVPGAVKTLEHAIASDPYNDLADLLTWMDKKSTTAAYAVMESGGAPQYKLGLFSMAMRAKMTFIKHYWLKQGYQDGFNGFLMALSQSYCNFMKYTKLRMLQNGRASSAEQPG